MKCMARAAAALVVLGGLSVAAPASAKSKKDASYSFEQVWPAAVRFIRIDEGLEIVEKDAESGYVMFKLKEQRRTFPGALEIVRIVDSDGRKSVRLLLRLEDRPSYMEVGILKRLLYKLRQELGPPAPAPKQKPEDKPKKKPDPDKNRGKTVLMP